MRTVNLLVPAGRESGFALTALLAGWTPGIALALTASAWIACAGLDHARLTSARDLQTREIALLRGAVPVSAEPDNADAQLSRLAQGLALHRRSAQFDTAFAAIMLAAPPNATFEVLRAERRVRNPASAGALGESLESAAYSVEVQGTCASSLDIVRFAGAIAGTRGFHSVTTQQLGERAHGGDQHVAFVLRATYAPVVHEVAMEDAG